MKSQPESIAIPHADSDVLSSLHLSTLPKLVSELSEVESQTPNNRSCSCEVIKLHNVSIFVSKYCRWTVENTTYRIAIALEIPFVASSTIAEMGQVKFAGVVPPLQPVFTELQYAADTIKTSTRYDLIIRSRTSQANAVSAGAAFLHRSAVRRRTKSQISKFLKKFLSP